MVSHDLQVINGMALKGTLLYFLPLGHEVSSFVLSQSPIMTSTLTKAHCLPCLTANTMVHIFVKRKFLIVRSTGEEDRS